VGGLLDGFFKTHRSRAIGKDEKGDLGANGGVLPIGIGDRDLDSADNTGSGVGGGIGENAEGGRGGFVLGIRRTAAEDAPGSWDTGFFEGVILRGGPPGEGGNEKAKNNQKNAGGLKAEVAGGHDVGDLSQRSRGVTPQKDFLKGGVLVAIVKAMRRYPGLSVNLQMPQ
jgi:hypothetical protein